MNTYEVWRLQNVPFIEGTTPGHSFLVRTNHTIKARTQKEAEYKLQQKFKNAGFHHMGLIIRKVEEQA